jgi:hypothetical protein
MIDDAATPVQVRVASPEVYNGAGIAVPPVLASLNLSVMRRDGRQFLHVTSLRSVDADHVHLYLELVDKGQRAVRLVTLWLTPDPNPAPPPVPVPAPAPAHMPASVPDAVLLAQVERARAAHAATVVAPRPARIVVARPAPVARVAAPPVAPPACARPAAEAQAAQALAAQTQACAALGAKNDELRARLGQVEDRMKKLQATLAAPAAAPAHKAAPVKGAPAQPETPREKAKPAGEDAAAVHAPPKPAVPAGPRPIRAIKPLVPHKPKAPPPEEGVPWGWIGAALGLLALGGGGAFVLVRRRGRGVPAAAVAPGLFDKLKARFAARTRASQTDASAEPTLE